ncbi:MAG: ATP-binding protein [Bacteroidota bacterium]
MQILIKYLVGFILLSFFHVGFSQKSIKDFYKVSNQQFNTGKYVEALNTNLEVLKAVEKGTNCYDIAFGHLQVGKMYYYLKEKRMALKSFFIAKTFIDSCNIDSLKYKVNHNIGAMYGELGSVDTAFFYLNRTLLLLANTTKYKELAIVNSVIADLHINRTKNLNLGEEYLVRAEKFAKLSQDEKEMIFAKIKRGALYSKKSLFKESLLCYKEALAAYEKLNYIEGRMYMLKSVADALTYSKNPEAIKYYEKLLGLKDSIFRSETASNIAKYGTLYETEKKVKENQILLIENSLNHAKISSRNKTIVVLSACVLLIVIFTFWRITILNLKKKKRELESAKLVQKEKERISRDLHDNVGGQLSYVLYAVDGLKNADHKKQEELGKSINESVRNVIANLRETIWAINDEVINVSDFCDKLKVYARSMFRNTKTKVVFEESISETIQLNSLIGLNLYRICQEIINNAFKHSEADLFTITVSSGERIKVVIADNGKGFNVKNSDSGGYGLSNIKARAKENGIELSLVSENEKGTTYSLIV